MSDQSIQILAIEDSESDFLLIEHHLRSHGLEYALHRVWTNAALADALLEPSWDLALTDYRVPGMILESTLAMLAERIPEVPVLLLTGGLRDDRAVQMLKLGVWDWVFKNDLARLIPCIERSLREARCRRSLREHRNRLASLEACLPGLAFSYRVRPDGSSCMPHMSPGTIDLFGIDAATLAQDAAPLLARVHSEDAVRVSRNLASCGRSMSLWQDELRYAHPAEGERWLGVSAMPHRESDGSVLWLGHVQDIGERKQLEKTLADSQLRLIATIENAPGIAWIKDLDGRFVLVSRYAERALGNPKERLLGRRAGDVFPSDAAHRYSVADRRALDCGEPSDAEERIDLHGSTRRFLSRRFPLRDSEGRIRALAAFCVDIDPRKRVETVQEAERASPETLLAEGTSEVSSADDKIRGVLVSGAATGSEPSADAQVEPVGGAGTEATECAPERLADRAWESRFRNTDVEDRPPGGWIATATRAQTSRASVGSDEPRPMAENRDSLRGVPSNRTVLIDGRAVGKIGSANEIETAGVAWPQPERSKREGDRDGRLADLGILAATDTRESHPAQTELPPPHDSRPYEEAAAELAGASTIVDWERLQGRYASNPGFVERLAEVALARQGDKLEALRALKTGASFAELAAIAHSVKGSASNLCAPDLQELAIRTERAAREHAPDCWTLRESLAELLDLALAEIHTWLERARDSRG